MGHVHTQLDDKRINGRERERKREKRVREMEREGRERTGKTNMKISRATFYATKNLILLNN